MKFKPSYAIMGFLLVLGLALLFYPTVSSWYNSEVQTRAVLSYDDSVAKMNEETRSRAIAEARQYNSELTGQGITDPFVPGGGLVLPENYTSVLDAGEGIMGTIEIPAIKVNLPIYHGTSAKVLEKGVGHMEMTAFPVGGVGNHTVLTGHSALPSATLFTDLEKLELGDVFFINSFGSTVAYEVDRIEVVEPTNTKMLIPTSDKDYTSLVTCTPYAVNTHRLLVRGVRIPFEEASGEAVESSWFWDLPFESIVAWLVLIIVAIVVIVNRVKSRRARAAQDMSE